MAAVSQLMSNATATLDSTLNTLAQGITTTGMTTATVTAIQSALTTFVTSNTNNNTGVFLITETPVLGAVYRLTLTASVTDVAGNPVQLPRSAMLAGMLTIFDVQNLQVGLAPQAGCEPF